MRLRIAMVGGGIGSMIGPVHRAAIRLTDDFLLVAGAFSSDTSMQGPLSVALDMPERSIYPDWRELLEDSDVLRLDAVVIVTPNNSHVEIATAFARRGINIICEKPLGISWDGIDLLARLVKQNNLSFIMTHPYSSYPVIPFLRSDLHRGRIGKIRMVAVEYLQGWLSELVENKPDQRGAKWRENPRTGGRGGVLGDIGTHAFQLLEYITRLKVISLAGTVSAIEGRAVPDDAHLLLKLSNSVSGSLWCSQVATGCLNGLRIRVFGEKGSVSWFQEEPEIVHWVDSQNNETIYRKGFNGEGCLPAGHPEGYTEGFAQIYRNAARQILAKKKGCSFLTDAPDLATGIRGMRFIDAALKAGETGGWVPLDSSGEHL